MNARRSAQQQLIDLSTESGLTAARDGDHALALLWFARAAELSGEYPERHELSRIRYANWIRQVWTPVGTATMPGFRQDKDQFREFQFSPDGQFLMAAERNGACAVWDRATEGVVPLGVTARQAMTAAWEPRDGLLAVGGSDGKLRLLSPPSFRVVEELPAEGTLLAIAFSGDGRRVAVGGEKGARVWDRDQKKFLTEWLAHGGPVATLSFSSNGKLLATSARDKKARVFRVGANGPDPLFAPVPHIPAEYGINHGGADRVAPRFVADDSTLLTVERDGPLNNLQWRSAESGAVLRTTTTVLGHEYLGAFAVNPAADRVAVAWRDRILVMDARTGSILATAPSRESYWIEDLTFSANGRNLVAGGHTMKVEAWLLDESRDFALPPAFPPISHSKQVVRVALTCDGRHLAAALWDGTICFWCAPEGVPKAYQIEAGGATWVTLSADRRLILPRGTSFRGGSLRTTGIHDAVTGTAVGPELDPGGIIVDAAFSPDGTRVAIAARLRRRPPSEADNSSYPVGKRATCKSGSGKPAGAWSARSRCRRSRAASPIDLTAGRWRSCAPIIASCWLTPPLEASDVLWTRGYALDPSTRTFGL